MNLEAYARQAKTICLWLENGCTQDEFDVKAMQKDFYEGNVVSWYGPDTPMIGVFHSGEEWLELLKAMQSQKMVTARRVNGKIYYESTSRAPQA